MQEFSAEKQLLNCVSLETDVKLMSLSALSFDIPQSLITFQLNTTLQAYKYLERK